jgi:hypothetical protein
MSLPFLLHSKLASLRMQQASQGAHFAGLLQSKLLQISLLLWPLPLLPAQTKMAEEQILKTYELSEVESDSCCRDFYKHLQLRGK